MGLEGGHAQEEGKEGCGEGGEWGGIDPTTGKKLSDRQGERNQSGPLRAVLFARRDEVVECTTISYCILFESSYRILFFSGSSRKAGYYQPAAHPGSSHSLL